MGSAVSAGASGSAIPGAPEPSPRAAARAKRNGAPGPAVALRPGVAEDCRAVWGWRNDDGTRRASLDSSFIEYEAHRRWFLDSLLRPDRKIYIVLDSGEPCGVVRLDVAARYATVSIFLDPRCQGRGIGPQALDAVADLAGRDLHLDRLLAVIKPDTVASIAAFARAGFTPSTATAVAAGPPPPSALTMVRVLTGRPAE